MLTSSCKQKARVLQQSVVKKILESFPHLTENDCRSTPMGCSGVDIQLSEAALKVFPFSVEAKNQEALSIWAALKQAESESRKGTPLLIFKRNRSDTYCCLKFNDFMSLIQQRNINDETAS